MANMTLFEKYGGFATVSRIVIAFYDKVLDSDEVGHYFEDTDMRLLIDHQTKFVSSVMGGPASFTDDMLMKVHKNFGISRSDFDEVARMMKETLSEFEVSENDIDTIMQAIESRSSVIISG